MRAELLLEGLEAPVFLAAPKQDGRLFVVERAGTIRVVREGAVQPLPFLDIRDRVSTLGERGLLGLTFSPDYPDRGFFVYYLNHDGESVVSHFSPGEDPDRADPREEIVLIVPQRQANHNGGTLAFRAGWLYLALGDGGGAGDPGECAQDPSTPLGKMLRLDLDRIPPGGLRVPFDRSAQACPGPLPVAGPGQSALEVWAKGLRNPFRWSFDALTGDLWIADVGQSQREEVNFEPFDAPGGANYGWDVMEGTVCFEPDATLPPCYDEAYTAPFHEYTHADGCSVTGGVVYRGAIPELQGQYVFGDFCSARIWTLDPRDGGVTERTHELSPSDPGGVAIGSVVAFGEDGLGELYIVDLGGRIFRIRPAEADADGDDVPDDLDTCPLVANREQADRDGDGIGDRCECGDASGDGRVNTTDARLIQRCAVGQIPCLGLCDVTGEGNCTTTDARLVQRFAVGELTKDVLVCAARP